MIIGYLDEVRFNHLHGWAYDTELGSAPVYICIYINGVLFSCIKADENRADIVANPDVGDSYHGYSADLSCVDGDEISVYAIVYNETNMQELFGSPMTLENNVPIGYLDEVTANSVRGWAYDIDAGKNPVDVHIYDGDKIIAMTKADQKRDDLTSVIGDPNHGFNCTFPKLSLGTHTIHAYAINVPAGVNLELANSPKTIEVTGPAGIWREITGGKLYTAGESLFYMKKFSHDGKLYGATEDSGKTVRFNGANWDVVFDTDSLGYGRWVNSYHLGEFGPFLYTGFRNYFDTPTSIKIFRTEGNVWSHVHEEPGAQQVRFIDDFFGGFITLFSSYSGGWTKIYRKTDPNQRDIGTLVKTLPYWNYGDPIVVNGKIYTGGWGIYILDSNFNMQKVYDVNSDGAASKGATITSIHIYKGAKHATYIQGFRSTTGNGLLLREAGDGTWKVVIRFPEPEAWCQETYLGDFYAGTRKEGGGGKVYMIGDNYVTKVVGTTKADGFFSLRANEDKLYAGTYSLTQVRSYMYS